MSQCDAMIYLIINVGHTVTVNYILWSSDFALYLEVYLIVWIMGQCDAVIDLIINVGHTVTVNYISWSSDFALYLEVYLIV